MKPEFEKYELIDAYLQGELTGSELTNFEAEMASNPSLKMDVESQQMANSVILDSAMLDLKLKMDAYRPTAKTGFSSLHVFIVAAGICTIAGLVTWFSHNDSAKPNITEISQPQAITAPAIVDSINASESEIVLETSSQEEDQELLYQETTETIDDLIEEDVVVTNGDNIGKGDITISSDIIEDVTGVKNVIPEPLNNSISRTEVKTNPCLPTTLYPIVEFDEFYKYIDVEIAAYGSLEPPFTYRVNDAQVESFKNLKPESCKLTVIDKNGCEGTANLTITPIED